MKAQTILERTIQAPLIASACILAGIVVAVVLFFDCTFRRPGPTLSEFAIRATK